ncbi:MAG: 50S ribosomal protein L20 [Spirochaetales bacterium]
MRIKRSVNALKKRRKILKAAKGYRATKSTLYRVARQAVMKSGQYAYIGRRLKKRDMRSLWITRINAAARLSGLSYSNLMHGLKLANVELNRKVLAELAVKDAAAFANLAETAKKALAKETK